MTFITFSKCNFDIADYQGSYECNKTVFICKAPVVITF